MSPSGATLCGITGGDDWMHDVYGGTNVVAPAARGAQVIWVR